MISCSTFFLSSLFHFAKCPQGPSVLLQMARFPSLSRETNVVYITHCVIYTYMSIYHIFFTHSSVDGHGLLGCSHSLAIVNNAEMIMGVQIFFDTLFLFLLDRYTELDAGSYSSIFNFLRKLHTVFHVTIPVYIPTNSVQEFPFLHVFTNILLFDNIHSNKCEMISHCGFDIHFLMISDTEYLSCTCWPFVHVCLL